MASVSDGVRRVADDLGRLEAGRELLRRLAPGRVLAVDAVRGLAVAPLLAPLLAPFLAVPALAEVLALPVLAELALAVLALAVLALAVLALAVLALAVLALAAVLGFRAEIRALPEVARADLDAGLDDDAVRGLAEPARFALDDAGRAGAAGLATDSVFAAVVRALAAVVMAFVAVFMDCIAVDIVLADEVARVAAAVILVAAEVTLVAADETVLAAVADVGLELADEVRVLRTAPARAGLRPVVLRAVVLRAVVLRPVVLRPVVLRAVRPPAALMPRVLFAVPAVECAVVLRVDDAAVPRVDELAPVARAVALVLGRPAERLTALVLTDRVLLELAGLRRAVARVVVCTGTDFPPS